MSIGAQPSFSAMATFPGGFAGGLVVQNVPIVNSWPGRVFWVDSNNGSDNNRGTFARPFASITGGMAIMASMSSQSTNDLLVAKPNHTETVSSATGMILSLSGMTIVGMGAGDARPTVTLDTAATATIAVRASGLSFQNFKFVSNFLNVTSLFTLSGASVTGSLSGQVFTVTAVGSGTLYAGSTLAGTGVLPGTVIMGQLTGTAGGVGTYSINRNYTTAVASGTVTTVTRGFTLDRCEFRDTSAVKNFLAYVTTSAVSNAADGLTITNSTFVGSHATSACVLASALGTNDRVYVADNYFTSVTTDATGVVPIAAGKVLTNAMILRNVFNLKGAAGTTTGILVTTDGSTNSGLVAGNYVQNLDATTPILATASSGLIFAENYYQSAADKSGALLPANA